MFIKPSSLSILLCIFLPLTDLLGQQPIPVIRGSEHPTVFVSRSGDEVFRLPAGHLLSPSTVPYSYFAPKQYLEVFRNGKALVKDPNGAFYWIDETGATIKTFPNDFLTMTAESDGCSLYAKKDPDRYGVSWFYFLDDEGNPAFGERKFWEASPFSEGLAAVQETEDGPWTYINTAGETIITIPSNSQVSVKEMFPFTDGMALVVFRPTGTYTSIYAMINREGKVIINLNRKFPGRTFNYKPIVKDSLIYFFLNSEDGVGRDLSIYNNSGQEIASFAHAGDLHYLNKNCWYYEQKTPTGSGTQYRTTHHLMDKFGQLSEFPIELNFMTDDYCGHLIYAEWTLLNKETGEREQNLISFPEMETRFTTTEKIVGYDEELLLVKSEDESFRMQTYDGEVLWRSGR